MKNIYKEIFNYEFFLLGNGAFIMRARRICNNLREGGKATNLS